MRNLEGFFFLAVVVAIVTAPIYLSANKKTVEMVINEYKLKSEYSPTVRIFDQVRTTSFLSMEECMDARRKLLEHRKANKENYEDKGIRTSVKCQRIVEPR